MSHLIQIKWFLWIVTCLLVNTLTGQSLQKESSLEHQIGQMIMVGFRGLKIDSSHSIVNDIQNYHIGGVILFDYDLPRKSPVRNIKSPRQLKKLTKQLQSFAKTPLFIAIDQEGGTIQRLKPKFGFPETLTAESFGTKNDTTFTRKHADRIAQTLSESGINFNFAPVVDLNRNPSNPIIGKLERSFSSDPEIVTQHASVFIRAHREKCILTCIKHFPGHGSSAQDSHHGTVDITKTWNKVELKPYQNLINRNLGDAIMTAHVFHRQLDPLHLASLSKPILTGVLRNQLQFEGVIICDDLQMKAIKKEADFKKAIELAVNAGVDILLFANNMEFGENIAEKTVITIKELIQEGKISQQRIAESYERIVKLKQKLD